MQTAINKLCCVLRKCWNLYLIIFVLATMSKVNAQIPNSSVEVNDKEFACSSVSSQEVSNIRIEVEALIAESPNWDNCVTGSYTLFAAWDPVPSVSYPYYSVDPAGGGGAIELQVNETRMQIASSGGITVGNNCGAPGCPCSETGFWKSVELLAKAQLPLAVSAHTEEGWIGSTCGTVENLEEFCGDAITQTPNEECDHGPLGGVNGGNCEPNCLWSCIKSYDLMPRSGLTQFCPPKGPGNFDPNDFSECQIVTDSMGNPVEDITGDGKPDCLVNSISDDNGASFALYCRSNPGGGYSYQLVYSPPSSSGGSNSTAGECLYLYGKNTNTILRNECSDGESEFVGGTVWRNYNDQSKGFEELTPDEYGVFEYDDYIFDAKNNSTERMTIKKYPDGKTCIQERCTKSAGAWSCTNYAPCPNI